VRLVLPAAESPATRRVAFLVAVPAAVVVALVLGVRALDASPHRITSNSMAPEIERGDFVVVTGGGAAVDRGEVVLFRFPPGSSGRAVKRAVAVGGDTVAVTDGSVAVNGRTIAVEPLAGEHVPRQELRVPDGHVFLLGDNSAVSLDSRSFGPVPEGEVVGRVRLVVPPPSWWWAAVAAGLAALCVGALAGRRRRRAHGRA
jgi:signal peptidase I